MSNWVDLVGVPFAYRGRGPNSYDCYGLVREMYRREGIDIPDYISPKDAGRITALFAMNLHLWEKVPAQTGTTALIELMTRKGERNMHCGYLVDATRMIHTWEDSGGVLVEPIEPWARRIRGFYRYVG